MAETTIRYDEQLRFVRGPNKGRPLTFVGIPFKIDGNIALFRDGSRAEFYVKPGPVEEWKPYICSKCRAKGITWFGACPHPPEECGQAVAPGVCEFLCTRDHGHAGEHVWELGEQIAEGIVALETVNAHYSDEAKPKEFPEVFCPIPSEETLEEHTAYMPEPRHIHPEHTIAAYRTATGKRPGSNCEPVYCVCRKGEPIYNYDRHTVGTGLREYLWLYEELRELGRGRWAALWEAREIYFL